MARASPQSVEKVRQLFLQPSGTQVISAWHSCLCGSLRNLHVCRQIPARLSAMKGINMFLTTLVLIA